MNLLSISSVTPPKPKKKVSLADGTTTILFNNEINIPDNFIELVEARKRHLRRSKDELPLIDVKSVAGPDSDPTRIGIENW